MASNPNLTAALVQLQADLPKVEKSETAKVEMKGGGSYSYSYADLANISGLILPRLAAVGLAFICKPTYSEGKFVLAYSLLHTSGEREDGEYPLPTGGTPQALGSAITYGRRYCLCAVTGIAPEADDDASAAEAEQAGRRGTAQRSSQPRGQKAEGGGTAQRRASVAAPPVPGDGRITREQRERLRGAFFDAGYTDKAEMLAYARKTLERNVESADVLTQAEAERVITALTAPPDDTKPAPGAEAEAVQS